MALISPAVMGTKLEEIVVIGEDYYEIKNEILMAYRKHLNNYGKT